MKITLKTLASKIGGSIIGQEYSDTFIENVLFDSRMLNSSENTVFFAIKSPTNNGNNYIEALYNKGVRMFVTDQKPKNVFSAASFLICENSVVAFQTLALLHRQQQNIKTICAITGSNGKTITKDWITKLIDNDQTIYANAKSFNSQIGVPFSVCQLQGTEETAIFEAGISQKDEMQTLEKIIEPNIGIFTNIGDAHQINFASLEEKIDEKLKLFINCKKLIFHNSKQLLTDKIKAFAQQHCIKLVSWGEDENDTYKYNDIIKDISIPFKDIASIENAINAYIFCLEIGINKENLQKRVPLLEQIEMRFELKQGINNSVIINDSYSNDYTSLELALDKLNRQKKKLKLAFLSDLQQSSCNLEKLYSDINTLLHNKGIDNLIAIGKDFCTYRHLIDIPNTQFYTSTQEYLNNAKRSDYTNKAILIKGARSFHFELISRLIADKGHQSVLEINLSALTDNVRYFHNLLKPTTKLMAMVKASSYGSGGYEVATALEKSNMVDYLTVAFADEGVELRKHGIQLPIMVVTPEEESLEKFQQYNLEPVVHSFDTLQMFVDKKISIHIKLDTGMHRLGFEEYDIQELISKIQTKKNITIKSVFSHFYGADDENLDKYTLQQIDLFEKMSDEIINAFPYKILRHICNSAGIVRFPQAHYDMVRLGIGMYGIGVNENQQQYLRTVHRFKTIITQVREIEAGEDVSYSRKFVSKSKTKIGVIPVGYADGLNRHLGNEKLTVYVNGYYAPIIGNICMDMCMIDISNIEAKAGDTVVIFGEENPAAKLAKILDTIPYEIFTSLAQRLKRVYFFE